GSSVPCGPGGQSSRRCCKAQAKRLFRPKPILRCRDTAVCQTRRRLLERTLLNQTLGAKSESGNRGLHRREIRQAFIFQAGHLNLITDSPKDGLTHSHPLIRPPGSTHLCRSHPCGSVRRGEPHAPCPSLTSFARVLAQRVRTDPLLPPLAARAPGRKSVRPFPHYRFPLANRLDRCRVKYYNFVRLPVYNFVNS